MTAGTDLLVITPSRGRPARLAAMLDATLSTAARATRVAVALDDDDAHQYAGLREARAGDDRVLWFTGARDTLCGWTNTLARSFAADVPVLASFGDDHLPRTPGWDAVLLDAIAEMGGTGIAYPDDRRRADIPEAPAVSSDITGALGWMMLPSCRHFYADNALADLGRAAGCLAYCPQAVVEHAHWSIAPGVERDATYAQAEAEAADGSDMRAWLAWRDHGGLDADAAAVRALRERSG